MLVESPSLEKEFNPWTSAEARFEEAANRLGLDEGLRKVLNMPAREMLADLFLELRDPAQALAEYEQSLKQCPKRFNGLYGAARAAELAGSLEKARTYFAQLAAHRDQASDRRELEGRRDRDHRRPVRRIEGTPRRFLGNRSP